MFSYTMRVSDIWYLQYNILQPQLAQLVAPLNQWILAGSLGVEHRSQETLRYMR